MRKRRLLYSSETRSDEINVTPLIDIVFILLIFFIVTTVFVEETGVEVQRPQAASSDNLSKNSILIAITAEGNVVYGGREIGVQGVRGTVQRLVQQEEMPVIIQADRNVSVDLYTKVHDAALLGGARQVSLATSMN
ncbi:MAG TPA: biopolymer transporter ExbD [Opitutales bacterium]|nr:biopolymer transporter ExbD [Opitutales bacterium]